MDDAARRAQLESLLTGPVGRPTWDALWTLLLAWPDGPDREAALADADARLDAWPDTERHVGSDWAPLYVGRGQVTPVARLVRSVDLYRRSEQGTLELTRLAGSPHLANLRRLAIVRCELGGDAWRALGSSPHLRRLAALDIHHTDITSDELARLLGTPVAQSLRSLGLRRLGLRGAALASMLGALPDGVTALDLAMNAIGPHGAAALVARAPRLEVLSLADNPLGDDGAVALAAWPQAGLRVLDLSRTSIGPRGRTALAAAAHLARTAISFDAPA